MRAKDPEQDLAYGEIPHSPLEDFDKVSRCSGRICACVGTVGVAAVLFCHFIACLNRPHHWHIPA